MGEPILKQALTYDKLVWTQLKKHSPIEGVDWLI